MKGGLRAACRAPLEALPLGDAIILADDGAARALAALGG
eukprot:CAMPEP_0202081286 /NCGR_PEP_ID=MMETSP0964-20121228/13369_1 /ASSEMBLY_ACC=CAM_ASM_000500 /TAXON_ID=4773 /ORGANISM="Schizochytrium aggregatum, Strain ATCC28209" /LENGTH=38 /DNA_ID= /DNA_START= /DNA_END= /DNA_ORIENTATION=